MILTNDIIELTSPNAVLMLALVDITPNTEGRFPRGK